MKKQLDIAVKKEDYYLAIYLRDKIKNYEKDQEEIKAIENELKELQFQISKNKRIV